ncbi:hypothetical protein [Novipirellula artificiosorum]|uniref:Uncharacterized protein n=1 Tax=Novipirellula artificiosorum TaxID=2528016 RepID=A0A5C6DFR4_9BACT|nr:hypothetical protein [Novipirellula artificiosorum]TWU33819.1 hypothetical protein Poly41_48180 [Novipirellula artificiosorum]
MSVALEPATQPNANAAIVNPTATVGERLQAETTAVRLHIRWPGVRKTLSSDQTRQAAGTFDADTKSVSASKKLLDTSHPAFRAVTAVKTKAADYWKSNTLPYTEPGMRLIRRDDVAAFDMQLTSARAELTEAVEELERHYDELVDQARERLGDLFDPGDYDANLRDQFAIEWDYPSCNPPEYLLQVSPQLYYSECARVQTRFDESVRLAEQAFADELSQLVNHLAERLSGSNDGSPKVFRDTAVTNLLEFFERFQRLNIRSDDQLDRLVADARQVIGGVQPQDLRDQATMRQQVARDLTRVEASLDGWMTDRPRRSILRRSK